MRKKSLDNLSNQECKEMIDGEIIDLTELDNNALEQIMNHEIDMLCHNKGDMELIGRCAELLNERNEDKTLDKEKIVSIIAKAESEYVVLTKEEEETRNPETKAVPRKRRILRRIGLIAAVLGILLATSTLVAAAFGESIREYLKMVIYNEKGTKVETDGITVHNGGEAKTYSTIEEIVEAEGLNIMYPTKFPNNINIDCILINEGLEGNIAIHIPTNNINTGILIDIGAEPDADEYDDSITYESNGKTYTVFQEESFFAICFYNNNRYSIQAESYDDLILIIENMKE